MRRRLGFNRNLREDILQGLKPKFVMWRFRHD